MNGRHQGSYLLVEQIKTDKNRVPIPGGNDALDPEEGGGPTADPAQMGFLIEIDRYWGNKQFESSDFWWPSKRYNGSGTTRSSMEIWCPGRATDHTGQTMTKADSNSIMA